MNIFEKEITTYFSHTTLLTLLICFCVIFVLIKFTKDFIGFEEIWKDLSEPPIPIVLFAVISFGLIAIFATLLH